MTKYSLWQQMGRRWWIKFGSRTEQQLSFLLPEEAAQGRPGETLTSFLLHGCTSTRPSCSPSTMLSMSASTGPLEGASGTCMVYSPTFSFRGFSFSTGWYSNKSSRVIMPPGAGTGMNRVNLKWCVMSALLRLYSVKSWLEFVVWFWANLTFIP